MAVLADNPTSVKVASARSFNAGSTRARIMALFRPVMAGLTRRFLDAEWDFATRAPAREWNGVENDGSTNVSHMRYKCNPGSPSTQRDRLRLRRPAHRKRCPPLRRGHSECLVKRIREMTRTREPAVQRDRAHPHRRIAHPLERRPKPEPQQVLMNGQPRPPAEYPRQMRRRHADVGRQILE